MPELISFMETKKAEGQYQASNEGREPQMFSMAKNCCTDKQCMPVHCNGESASLVYTTIPDVSGRLPDMLLNHLVVMLVNCLVWRKKLLMNCSPSQKKDHQHALDFQVNLPCFLCVCRRLRFPLRLLFSFWVVMVNLGFLCIVCLAVILSLKQNLDVFLMLSISCT